MGLFSFFKNKKTESDVDVNVNATEQKSDIPSFQGDYAKTIFLFSNEIAPISPTYHYHSYLTYGCGIKNPLKYHKQLLDEGYFKLASPQEKLRTFTLKRLKEIAKQFNVNKSGTKSDIIKKIIDTVSDDQINALFDTPIYSLSAQGRLFLEHNNDYVIFHKNRNDWQISYKEYSVAKTSLLNGNKTFQFYDVIWKIANERLLTTLDFGCSEYLLMYRILEQENRLPEAVRMLLLSFYINLNIEPYHVINAYKKGYLTKVTQKTA